MASAATIAAFAKGSGEVVASTGAALPKGPGAASASPGAADLAAGIRSSFSFTRGGKPHCWDQGLGCRGQVLRCRGSGLGCWNHGHCGRGPRPTTLVSEIAAVISRSAVLRVRAGADRSCDALGSRPECSLYSNRLEWANAHIGWDGIWHVEEVFSSQMNPGFRRSGQMADSVWRFADVNVVDQVAHGGSGAMLGGGVRCGQ